MSFDPSQIKNVKFHPVFSWPYMSPTVDGKLMDKEQTDTLRRVLNEDNLQGLVSGALHAELARPPLVDENDVGDMIVKLQSVGWIVHFAPFSMERAYTIKVTKGGDTFSKSYVNGNDSLARALASLIQETKI